MEAVSDAEQPTSSLNAAQVLRFVTGALLLLGLVLRLRGFLLGTISLYEDEAAWALRLVSQPLSAHDIRPLGFMALSKLLVTLLPPSETVLRALPWLGGLASLAMAPLLAERLFVSAAARLLFVAVIALHPGAIDLAKEFKPYSVSLALHMALLLFALRYLGERKPRDLLLLLALLFGGTLLSQDAIFAYPGMFALLLLVTYRAGRRRELAWVGLTALATLALLTTFYFAFWRHSVGRETTHYWGEKYDVFYVKGNPEGARRVGWTGAHLAELAALPGIRRHGWHSHRWSDSALGELRQIDSEVWLGLALLGAGALFFRRRGQDQVLLLAPLALMVVFNRYGYWPLGAFRTNLFALVYVAAIACCAIDTPSPEPPGLPDLVPAFGLVLLPFLLLGRTDHSVKSSMGGGSEFAEALRMVAAQAPPPGANREELVLDGGSCSIWRYYSHVHPARRKLRGLRRHFDVECTRSMPELVHALRRAVEEPDAHAFALLSRYGLMENLDRKLPRDLQIESRTVLGQYDQLVLRVKRR